jgi:hypothetical protein
MGLYPPKGIPEEKPVQPCPMIHYDNGGSVIIEVYEILINIWNSDFSGSILFPITCSCKPKTISIKACDNL